MARPTDRLLKLGRANLFLSLAFYAKTMFPSLFPLALFLGLTPGSSWRDAPPAEAAAMQPVRVAADTDFGLRAVTFTRSAPPRWSQVIARHRQQVSQSDEAWRKLVAPQDKADAIEVLKRVNKQVNRATYVSDEQNWGIPDYWATPQELMERGGDCEDYAVAKYLMLRELGVSASQLHIAVGVDHAFLVVMTEAGNLVLDNRDNELRQLQPRDFEDIVFTVNEAGWSVNVDRQKQQRFASAGPYRSAR
jgi:predicted transglutaminase-like cysteine proteinase